MPFWMGPDIGLRSGGPSPLAAWFCVCQPCSRHAVMNLNFSRRASTSMWHPLELRELTTDDGGTLFGKFDC